MNARGRILIADDEETFLHATAELLRDEGYVVGMAADADAAIDAVRRGSYDLVISDLEMPGNEDLRLVRLLAHEAGGLPVIIVTGFPSAQSAMAAIELPVAAYLPKPVKWDDLLERIEASIGRFRAYRHMRRTEEQLEAWRREFGQTTSPSQAAKPANGPQVDAFLALTLRSLIGSAPDGKSPGGTLNGLGDSPPESTNGSRELRMEQAINDAVTTLRDDADARSSAPLSHLRLRLQSLLARAQA